MNFHNLDNSSIYQVEEQSSFLTKFKSTDSSDCISHLSVVKILGTKLFALCLLGV